MRSARCLLKSVVMILLVYVTLFLLIAGATLVFSRSSNAEGSATGTGFRVGTPVVYRQDEVSACPSSDARDIHPAEHGEYYYYSILHYLRVIEVLRDGRVVTMARDHERHCFWPNDTGLRKANLGERLFHPLRFPHL